MELTGPTPKTTDLIACGMSHYDLRPVDVEPTPGNRGYQAGTKALTWSCSISSFDPIRPSVRAIRDDPDEADRDARLRFMALFSGRIKQGQKLPDSISENPRTAIVKKIKGVVKDDLDDDAASLI